jgi:protocatechuate 3,4-dioxygenase beta subunit
VSFFPRAGLVLSLLLALAAGYAPQGPPAQTRDRTPVPTGTASLTGRLTLTENGQTVPVRRARVTLESSVLPRPPRVDTDTDGRFQFTNLPAGTYRVIAEKAGFVPRVSDPRRAFERPAPIELKDGQSVQLDIAMQRGAAIEGKVLAETGEPAMNVVVSAQRFVYDTDGRHLVSVQQARTDDRGQFRVHTLPPGEYYLEAGPDPLDVAARSTPAVLAHTFYPGTPRVDEARTIPVAVGQNASFMDITLTRMAVVAMRGRVQQSSGQPVKDMAVRLQRVGGPVGEVRGYSLPNTDAFEYPAVPPGEYWLMGVVRPTPGADLEFGATRVTVAGQPLTDVVITTAKGAALAGQVIVEGAASPLPADLQVIAYDSAYVLPPLPGSAAGPPVERVDASGAFSFTSLFGPRLLRVEHLPTTWAIKSISLDGTDIADTITDFRATDRPRAVRIVITPRTATVRGVVTGDSGRPAVGVRVVVFSNDERQWHPRSRLVRVSESDADGQYVIEGLVGGDYSIVAVPYLEDGSWMDANVLRGLRAIAAPVALRDGASMTVALKVR